MDGYLFKWVNKSIAKKSKLESGGKREREREYIPINVQTIIKIATNK